jgi:hypothetical protein
MSIFSGLFSGSLAREMQDLFFGGLEMIGESLPVCFPKISVIFPLGKMGRHQGKTVFPKRRVFAEQGNLIEEQGKDSEESGKVVRTFGEMIFPSGKAVAKGGENAWGGLEGFRGRGE